MVNKKLLHPQEVETFYVLPTLRRYLAKYMKEAGMKQKDVAELLMVNTATLSQYASSKRGHQINFEGNILDEIKKSASIIDSKLTYFRETQRLLKLIRSTNALCAVHRQVSFVPAGCSPTGVGCTNEDSQIVLLDL